MARGSIGLLVVFMGLAFSGSRADDFFPTYRDHLTMEEQSRQVISDMEDQARISVVSLTGSTSNYTVNLSGIVLLSLSLSAAVMLWGYLYTLFERNKNKGSTTSNQDSYSGGGGYYKRSVDDDNSLPIILSNLHRRFEEAAVNELDCRQRILCEIGSSSDAPPHSLSHNVNTLFSLTEKNETMKFELDDQARTYLKAWTDGKRHGNKLCKSTYDKCLMKSKTIQSFLINE